MTTLLKTNNEKETIKLGEKIGVLLKKGDIVSLIGELGVGKTYLTKGIVKGMGLDSDVKSPTFMIINEYKGILNVYHFDCYRIKNFKELERLGYEEYFYGDGVTIIEWADKIRELLPANCINITMRKKNKNQRLIQIKNLRQEFYK
ncbi:MAG: tRNA (adenosine(37)-N6)-threonylcarbamoyltransferase complex ATPase subunit type 1 TsaE [Candidatus Firestonebacteria bacterium]